MERPKVKPQICKSCKDAKHDKCIVKRTLGSKCDCIVCKEEFLKTLRISEVEIKNDNRCLKVQIGNTTTFLDVRDLYQCPSWNDREDNAKETLQKIRSQAN